METANFMNSFRGSHELCVALQLCMACDLSRNTCHSLKNIKKINSFKNNINLKVIFLLTHKCVIDVGKIKTFICIHSIMRNWPKMYLKYTRTYYRSNFFFSFQTTIITQTQINKFSLIKNKFTAYRYTFQLQGNQ